MTLYSIKEAAEELHCAPCTIRRLENKGLIAFRKIGNNHYYTPGDLEEFLENVKIPAWKIAQNKEKQAVVSNDEQGTD